MTPCSFPTKKKKRTNINQQCYLPYWRLLEDRIGFNWILEFRGYTNSKKEKMR